MSMTTLTPPSPLLPSEPSRRITVSEYHAMVRAGILGPEDRVELLEGWIIAKMPRNPPHDALISFIINRVLFPRLATGWFVRGQSAVTTADSEPEPDIAVVRGSERDYLDHHPGPTDMALVIEVLDSTLARDRTLKARLYANAGIPFYWIVNLIDSRIEVYSSSTGPDASPSYRHRQELTKSDFVDLIIDGHVLGQIAVAELLP